MKGKLADGKTIGGTGRLSESKIKKLQKQYGLAIRQNIVTNVNPTDREVDVAVYTMKKNIIASLHHNVKCGDPSKQHRLCPPGTESWYKWQKDLATGKKTYSGSDCLPEIFLEVIRPVYMILSDSNLLRRCVRGATQNPNECLNSLVWVRCPKHKHHGAKTVSFAVASAICHFHGGRASRENVMQRLLMPAGTHTEHVARAVDRKRVRQSDQQATDKEKKRRQVQGLLRVQREETLREAEGVTYEAGGF